MPTNLKFGWQRPCNLGGVQEARLTADETTRASQTTPSRSAYGRLALWGAQLVLAAMFLFAGGSKLAGAPAMIALFDAIGAGHWLRYLTGAIECGSAIALVIPSTAVFGALPIVPTMLGAAATNVWLGQSPAVPLVLLLVAATIVWGRRDQLYRLLSR